MLFPLPLSSAHSPPRRAGASSSSSSLDLGSPRRLCADAAPHVRSSPATRSRCCRPSRRREPSTGSSTSPRVRRALLFFPRARSSACRRLQPAPTPRPGRADARPRLAGQRVTFKIEVRLSLPPAAPRPHAPSAHSLTRLEHARRMPTRWSDTARRSRSSRATARTGESARAAPARTPRGLYLERACEDVDYEDELIPCFSQHRRQRLVPLGVAHPLFDALAQLDFDLLRHRADLDKLSQCCDDAVRPSLCPITGP